MKIIKRGTPPDQNPIQGTCTYCHTEVEFLPIEARKEMHRNQVHYFIKCPVCDQQIIVADEATK